MRTGALVKALILVLALAQILAGCTGADRPAAAAHRITIAFAGDLMLSGSVGWVARNRGARALLGPVAGELQKADIAVGNLETAVTLRGAADPGKQYAFRSRPEYLEALRWAGFDLLTVANNHSRDFGPTGLLDTVAAVHRAGMRTVGGGADREAAWAPAMVEAGGVTVAFLGLSRVIPDPRWVAEKGRPGIASGWEVERAVAAVRVMAKQADLVVVLVHWGEELADHPRGGDAAFARALLGAGAHLVVGHHPHVLQGFRLAEGRLVAFSLGNFLFPDSGKPLTRQSGILLVEGAPGRISSARLIPVALTGVTPRPVPGATWLTRLDRLSRRWQTRVGRDGQIEQAGER